MIYSKEIFDKAEAEINRRHVNALADLERRRAEIAVISPEISQINKNLINTSVELSKAIMRKDTNIKETIEKIRDNNLKGQKLIKTLLDDFGYPIDYLELKFTCSKCQDTGYVNGYRCDCFNELLRRFSIEDLNQNCNIALNDFNDFNLDFYSDIPDERLKISPKGKMAANLMACKDYALNFNYHAVSLFLSGQTGLGKTFLSSAIAKELMLKGYHVAFDTIQNFLREIENEHFGRVTDRDTLQLLTNADLVILDDLGSEFSSPFYSSALYNILNARLNRNVPTIISSNFTLEQLQKKYDDRIISRLTGMFSWLIFMGKDIRQINSVMTKK